MKYFLYSCFVFLLVSCKSKQVLLDSDQPIPIKEVSTIKKFVKYRSNISSVFKTAQINSDITYESKGNSQRLYADIRIKKDEIIYVNIRFLGISMAKAMITPTEVQYYEKLHKTYFSGDFETLSQWFGIPLNYSILQNILLGEPVESISVDSHQLESLDNAVKVVSTKDKDLLKTYLFSLSYLSLTQQNITQPSENRNLQIAYTSYLRNIDQLNVSLPNKIEINAQQSDKSHVITIEAESISLNKELTFSYTVPKGYERIQAK